MENELEGRDCVVKLKDGQALGNIQLYDFNTDKCYIKFYCEALDLKLIDFKDIITIFSKK